MMASGDSAGEMAPGVRLDDFLPYLLNRIANRLNMALAEDLKIIGVSVPEYRVLAVLKARDGRTVKELSVYTVIEQSTLSKLLLRMETSGLIERRNDASDGRVVNVYLADGGETAFAQALPVALKHYRAAIAGLEDGERASLVRTLHQVLDNVRVSPFP